MKAGFNLLLWTDHVAEQHFPIVEKLARAGYDGVEIPVLEGTPSYYEKVRKVVKDNGLACDVVTNMPDVLHNPISPDRKLRANALEFMRRIIDCTQALGADLLCGPFYQPVGQFTGIGPTEDEKKRAVEHARASAEHAAAAGVTLAVEFLNRFEAYFLTTMDGVAEHVRAVGMPNFRAMFDTFHANIEEKNVAKAIETAGPYLVHVHANENDRGTPGSGHVPWKEVAAALKKVNYSGALVIESFTTTVKEIARAAAIWRPWRQIRTHWPPKGWRS